MTLATRTLRAALRTLSPLAFGLPSGADPARCEVVTAGNGDLVVTASGRNFGVMLGANTAAAVTEIKRIAAGSRL